MDMPFHSPGNVRKAMMSTTIAKQVRLSMPVILDRLTVSSSRASLSSTSRLLNATSGLLLSTINAAVTFIRCCGWLGLNDGSGLRFFGRIPLPKTIKQYTAHLESWHQIRKRGRREDLRPRFLRRTERAFAESLWDWKKRPGRFPD